MNYCYVGRKDRVTLEDDRWKNKTNTDMTSGQAAISVIKFPSPPENATSVHYTLFLPLPSTKKAGISLTYFSDFTHKTRKIKKGKRFVLYTIQLFQHGERSCIRNSYTSAGNGIKHAKIQQMLYFAVKTLSFKRNDMRGFLRNCHTSAGGGWVSWRITPLIIERALKERHMKLMPFLSPLHELIGCVQFGHL